MKLIKITEKGIFLSIKVVPKAHKSEVLGREGEELKVRLKAVPEKGEANLELISLLSKVLKVPKSSIILVQGQTSRHKKVLLQGADKAVEDLINGLIAEMCNFEIKS